MSGVSRARVVVESTETGSAGLLPAAHNASHTPYSTAAHIGDANLICRGAGILDLRTRLAGVRPEVDDIVLDPAKPALKKIAKSLTQSEHAENLPDIVHVIAHGRPDEMNFAPGTLSLSAIAKAATGNSIHKRNQLSPRRR
jgi:hypothetical protein